MKLSIKQINSIKRITLLLVLATMLPAVASAKDYDFEVNGICYNKAADDPAKVIVTYNKISKDHSPTYKKLKGDIIIPEVVNYKGNTYSVKEIGESAFMYCTDMNSVTIPSSVTKIGRDAFRGCSGMNSVMIPSSVTKIGRDAFWGCSGLTAVNINDIAAWCNIDFDIDVNQDYPYEANPLLYANNLYLNGNRMTEIVIPSTVHLIKNYVFLKCLSLTSVTIPNSVESIGDGAFYCCTGLKELTIPNSVTSIGYKTFAGCIGLTSITIPNSVTSIGKKAFSGCSGLQKVHCGIKSPAVFGNQHFNDNTYVFVPAECVDLYKSAWYCHILEEGALIPGTEFEQDGISYKVNDDGKTLHVRGNRSFKGDLIIPETVTFDGTTCKVTSIGSSSYDSFENCTGLTSVTIPNSVTSIGSDAFNGCTGLTSVNIGNSVTKIDYTTFKGCTGLTSVTIGNSVTSIGTSAFENCSGLTSVVIPNSVTSIGEKSFSGCSGLKSLTIGNSVTKISDRAFWGCSSLTSITIPNSVTSIGASAFADCTGLTSVTILGNSLEKVEIYAFENCGKLLLNYTGEQKWWDNSTLRPCGLESLPSGSGRKPTTKEINSVGNSNFNKLKNGEITRGMTEKAIDRYDELWDNGPLYDCLRIDVYRRQWTRDNTSVYTIGFEGYRDYYVTFRNGVVVSVAY